jgi:hypothetical protein
VDAPKPEAARRVVINLSARTASFTADSSASVAQDGSRDDLRDECVGGGGGASLERASFVNVVARRKCKCANATHRLAPRLVVVVVNMTSPARWVGTRWIYRTVRIVCVTCVGARARMRVGVCRDGAVGFLCYPSKHRNDCDQNHNATRRDASVTAFTPKTG